MALPTYNSQFIIPEAQHSSVIRHAICYAGISERMMIGSRGILLPAGKNLSGRKSIKNIVNSASSFTICYVNSHMLSERHMFKIATVFGIIYELKIYKMKKRSYYDEKNSLYRMNYLIVSTKNCLQASQK